MIECSLCGKTIKEIDKAIIDTTEEKVRYFHSVDCLALRMHNLVESTNAGTKMTRKGNSFFSELLF